MKTILFFTIFLFFVGCSNRTVYNNLQMHERSKCSKVPPSKYQKCRDNVYNKPYDKYEREYNNLTNR